MRLRNKWVKAEDAIAKLERGKKTPASGARWHSKGDVASSSRLVQVKSTDKKSFVLKLTDWDQIERQAAAADKEPVMVVEFSTPTGKRRLQVTQYFGVDDE